jgi:DNA-directed RNA polymerase specialized sigma24 family protein
MFSIAYRMLGRVAEARRCGAGSVPSIATAIDEGVAIESPKAFLATVATRLAIDHLCSIMYGRLSIFTKKNRSAATY